MEQSVENLIFSEVFFFSYRNVNDKLKFTKEDHLNLKHFKKVATSAYKFKVLPKDFFCKRSSFVYNKKKTADNRIILNVQITYIF